MVEGGGSVATQALQLWVSKSVEELGVKPFPTDPHPPSGVSLTSFAHPFSTWSDMSHLLPFEAWANASVPAPPKSLAYFIGVLPERDREPPTLLLHVMHRLSAGEPVSWIRWADGEMLNAQIHPYDPTPTSYRQDLRAAARRWASLPELYVAVNTAFFCGARRANGSGQPGCVELPPALQLGSRAARRLEHPLLPTAHRNYSGSARWSLSDRYQRSGVGFRLKWNAFLEDVGLLNHPRRFFVRPQQSAARTRRPSPSSSRPRLQRADSLQCAHGPACVCALCSRQVDFFYLPIFREEPWESRGVHGWLYETRRRTRALVAPSGYRRVAACLNATHIPSGSSFDALRPRLEAMSNATAEGVVFLVVAGSLAKLVGTHAFEAQRKDSFIDVGNAINDLVGETADLRPVERSERRPFDEERCAGFARGETWRRPKPPPAPRAAEESSTYDA